MEGQNLSPQMPEFEVSQAGFLENQAAKLERMLNQILLKLLYHPIIRTAGELKNQTVRHQWVNAGVVA